MRRQDIDVDGYWTITVYYNVRTPEYNQGFSVSYMDKRRSVVAIGIATSYGQLLNTVAHEAKHV